MNERLTYTTVATAIGEVAIWWSAIETMAHGLAIRLTILNEPAMNTPKGRDQLNLVLVNMGQRDLFSAVKALAFDASKDDLFPRLEPLLNVLDNDIRPERNRYIHDSWFATGELAERTSRSARIVNAQARLKELRAFHKTTFASFDELDGLVRRMKQHFTELETISEDISSRIAERKNLDTNEVEDDGPRKRV